MNRIGSGSFSFLAYPWREARQQPRHHLKYLSLVGTLFPTSAYWCKPHLSYTPLGRNTIAVIASRHGANRVMIMGHSAKVHRLLWCVRPGSASHQSASLKNAKRHFDDFCLLAVCLAAHSCAKSLRPDAGCHRGRWWNMLIFVKQRDDVQCIIVARSWLVLPTVKWR